MEIIENLLSRRDKSKLSVSFFLGHPVLSFLIRSDFSVAEFSSASRRNMKSSLLLDVAHIPLITVSQ
jgi:hypothetical protein